MKRHDDEIMYLNHILYSIEQIESYVKAVSIEQFLQNKLLQDGAIYRLGIIGKASGNFSDEFRKQHSEVPWSQIIGLRNRVIHAYFHEYFNLDLDIVWDIVKDDLPDLKQKMGKMLEEMQ